MARARIAIIGSGPAGLMAATAAVESQAEVHVFERRKGLGRKLLIAGSSGLNVSHDAPLEEFFRFYQERDPFSAKRLEPFLRDYPSERWLQFIRFLGHEVFVGTSRRWFVREMKASQLLLSWTRFLEKNGVRFYPDSELVDFTAVPHPTLQIQSSGKRPEAFSADAVVFACGGGSWEASPPSWPEIFRKKGLKVCDFSSSNVGYEVDFPEALIREAEGKPIKNCILKSRLGQKQGELVITRYGLEGTPVYFVGTPGEARIQLRPGLSAADFFSQLSRPLRENLSPLRRLKKLGGLSPAALALVFHGLPEPDRAAIHGDLKRLAQIVQDFPVHLQAPRPLEEAISSAGGLQWEELQPDLMLHKFPGFFAAGEMIDWDAPTGGFLIQASVALGYHAGKRASSRTN
ncbi:MAG: TIGR03862 family flavoprotein [Bdellovibrionales bacterium]|nr:TIGR03862 family flavoprotein [Bdellovibrionales bacterium]